ncbi:hypothetical protein [Sphingomonas sp. SUN039]|uniref:hypothetical protein n=1 Tax=Sphingomonas sp. SUN039 TaxID=2937787 RepID=UPI0021644E6E|nr:hypothetical protein [Sphingomonas sp. SUN039]UVO52961.1 hypothetical protein M0209_02060 [Sphingomonas sp. SUN039]
MRAIDRCSSVRILASALLMCALPSEVFARVTVKELFYILKRDGISNSLEPWTRITSIGRIVLSGRWYSFYFYDHVTPATNHGLRRILVLDDQKRYVGGYMVQEYGNCVFRPSVLMCEGEDRKLWVALDFKDGRLPPRAVIDGYDTVLEK